MLAPNKTTNVDPPPPPLPPKKKGEEPKPEKPEIRTRTIGMTFRAPIEIEEDKWEIIAEGRVGEEAPWGAHDGWKIRIGIRHEKYDPQWNSFCRYIVSGVYEYSDEHANDGYGDQQIVRVGYVLSDREAARDLYKTMHKVAADLRKRIKIRSHRQQVIYALDGCFASMAPVRW